MSKDGEGGQEELNLTSNRAGQATTKVQTREIKDVIVILKIITI